MCRGRFGDILGMCWGCFGDVSAMVWGCFGDVSGMFRRWFGIPAPGHGDQKPYRHIVYRHGDYTKKRFSNYVRTGRFIAARKKMFFGDFLLNLNMV